MKHILPFLPVAALSALTLSLANAQSPEPSRPVEQGCFWERLEEAGLSAWVQQCDFGNYRVRFRFDQTNLVQYTSNGSEPSIAVEVLDMNDGETAQKAMRRLYDAHTDAQTASRCAIAPYTSIEPPAGVERYQFVADADYAAEPIENEDPNEAAGPLCGDWGSMALGAQYFEVQPQSPARKILFVRVGEYQPLFDEQTLQLLPAATGSNGTIDAMELAQNWQGHVGETVTISGCRITSATPDLMVCLATSTEGQPPWFLFDPSGMTPEDVTRAVRECDFFVGYPVCGARLQGEVAEENGELKIMHGSVTWNRPPLER